MVKKNLCIGCGVCAGLCPKEILKMEWNSFGEYNPVNKTECTKECGLCLKVCPFTDHSENKDSIGNKLYEKIPGIRHTSETGYYLASYAGYSKKHRVTSASGGIATWILENLLAAGIVDQIICVAPNENTEKLFAFKNFSTVEEVREGAGSVYYPVEMSEVIKHINSTPGRYAITGLPCFIKAIRNAQKNNKKLMERIVVTVGLTCGQMKNKYYTTYLASLSGIREPIWVKYHQKSPNKPAADYSFICGGSGNQIGERIFFSTGVGEAWLNRWFTYDSCNYCDDIFAECADVNCMDAWLPEYWNEPEGNNIIIIRSQLVNELIKKGIENDHLHLKEITIKEVIKSQSEVIYSKRILLPYRLKLNKNGKCMKKRFGTKVANNPLLKEFTKLQMKMQRESKNISQNTQLGRDVSVAEIRKIMAPYLTRSSNVKKLIAVTGLPKSAIKKLLKKLCIFKTD